MNANTSNVVSLAKLPATVLQKAAHPDRSERYVHINTREVIAHMEKEGYEVASVQVTGSRSKTRDPLFARHQVTLRNSALPKIDGVVPQFMLTNSHDGSSSAQVLFGAFRFVCSNGLVIGTTFGRERVRHSSRSASTFIFRRAVGVCVK